MLIRGAELLGGHAVDVRIVNGSIGSIGAFNPVAGEPVIEANGGLLLPGLHDHHIHVAALAASMTSIVCGPPAVVDLAGLSNALSHPGEGWLRGIAYHESVAGLLDAKMLDEIVPDRPLRIQHRSGRMWFFNSLGLDAILERHKPPAGLERVGGCPTGRLFDADDWLRKTLGSSPPDFTPAGRLLARHGVTGLTEMSPANGRAMAQHFGSERAREALPQRVLLAGRIDLNPEDVGPGISLGPAKLHLHEADLPPLDDAIRCVGAAHAKGRPVAVHCATEIELIYALAAFADAGARPGDRIEHASVAPDHAIEEIGRQGLWVVSQPHFIAERGDAYLRNVDADAHPFLYRLRTFIRAGVTLAGGSDAPFGRADPWAAMAAAVERRTSDGATIGAEESLTPEEALDLFLRAPTSLGETRKVEVGAPADLCLLDRPWRSARDALSSDLVRSTLIAGQLVHDRVDQTPFERRRGADPAP